MIRPAIKPISLLLCLLALSSGVLAEGMRVSPLKLQFGPDSNSALLKVSNGGENTMTVQLELLKWTQDELGQDQYEPSSEIVFFPRIFSVEPGEQRMVRVGYQGPSAPPVEQAFRLYVQELPVQDPGQVEMKFAVRMGIPVFVSPGSKKTEWRIGDAELKGGAVSVAVENSGNRFIRVGDIAFTGRDASGDALFTTNESGWYVLARRNRAFALALDEAFCERLVSIELTVNSGSDARSKHIDVSGQNCTPGS